MAIHGVDFVVHYVPNLEEAVSFYQDTLGLKLELHNPDWNWAEFSLSPITLVLFGNLSGCTARKRQRRRRARLGCRRFRRHG